MAAALPSIRVASMRVLLDACIPQGLRHHLKDHQITTAAFAGLENLSMGRLLDAMLGSFDVIITTDMRLSSAHSLAGRPIAAIVLAGGEARQSYILALLPALQIAVDRIRPGEVREVPC